MATENMAVTLITQGEHKFYSGSMDIELISSCCSSNPREQDPIQGFQRRLDNNRAIAIAEYIQSGGSIPSSIILSAQEVSNLVYSSRNKTITFEVVNGAFLILDGQHRVFGFTKLLNKGIKYRVPVVIYNELSTMQEARLFIDINTLQKPVPRELLLDIKKLAQRESDDERLLDEVFTLFEESKDSFLLNKLSRIDKQKNKISKVTFYDAVRPIVKEFNIENTDRLYRIINSFLYAANDISRQENFAFDTIVTKPTSFKILISHARSIISMISDNNPEDLELVSGHKKYLNRSLPGSFNEIAKSKAYLKSVEQIDKKLLQRNVVI